MLAQPFVTTPPHRSCASKIANAERLRALEATGLLDSEAEIAFDRISAMVRYVLRVPVALVSLVDARRQFFKSALGLGGAAGEARETPLSHSFCQHVVATDEPLVVEDAREHPVVRDNLAIADLGVIAYLGVPIHAPDGNVLGSLCAIDSEPRAWTDDDLTAMRSLVASVETEIALRAEAGAQQRAARRANDEAQAFATVTAINTRLASELDPDRLVDTVVDAAVDLLGASAGAFLAAAPARASGVDVSACTGAPRSVFERFAAGRTGSLFSNQAQEVGLGEVVSSTPADAPFLGRSVLTGPRIQFER